MGKTVVITGTSTGIGRASVERMAASGWTVYAGVRKDADGDVLKRGISGDVRPVLIDVTESSHITALAATLTQELGTGGLDGLVNNAGVAEGGPIETVSEADWRWHFDVNVFGLVNLTRELLPLLLRCPWAGREHRLRRRSRVQPDDGFVRSREARGGGDLRGAALRGRGLRDASCLRRARRDPRRPSGTRPTNSSNE